MCVIVAFFSSTGARCTAPLVPISLCSRSMLVSVASSSSATASLITPSSPIWFPPSSMLVTSEFFSSAAVSHAAPSSPTLFCKGRCLPASGSSPARCQTCCFLAPRRCGSTLMLVSVSRVFSSATGFPPLGPLFSCFDVTTRCVSSLSPAPPLLREVVSSQTAQPHSAARILAHARRLPSQGAFAGASGQPAPLNWAKKVLSHEY